MDSYTRVFSVDPVFGVTKMWHYDPLTDTATIVSHQDVEPLVEANRALSNDAESGWKGEMLRVASIPIGLYWELHEKGITKDQKEFKRWLNDRENRHFRTRPGVV